MVQSPYARLTVGVPYLAISSSSSVVRLAVVLSESMSTASRVASVVVTAPSSRRAVAALRGARSATISYPESLEACASADWVDGWERLP